MDLLKRAARVGIKPAEFWLLCPAEFVAYCDGAAWQMKQARNLAVLTGWSSEAFARTKRLQGFDKELRRMFREPGGKGDGGGFARVKAALDSLARRYERVN